VYDRIVKAERKKKNPQSQGWGFFNGQVMKMLMKICANCGKKLKQGESCICQKERHKMYNAVQRDKDKNKFYHSGTWEKLVEVVKARANGLDELALAEGYFVQGNTVHHIYTIDERPDLKTSVDNLIYLSAANHNRIHKAYNRDAVTKRIVQAQLLGIIKPKCSLPHFTS
jgi:hypothetical protein